MDTMEQPKSDVDNTDANHQAGADGEVVPDESAGQDDDIEPDLFLPDGLTLDMDGDEDEGVECGPVSRIDIVPRYEASCQGILTDQEYSMETGKKINDAEPKRTCFNCLGDHNVSDCPEPQDAHRIAANRKKYNVTRVPNVRYHEDGENKYGHMQPGKYSDKLIHALGLRKDQVPLFVYRMRVLGYPPGWLRDAEVRQADIKMYDGAGKTVTHPDEEDGEVERVTVRYKPEKLVSFPGFNDPLPHGKREESSYYNFPPMQHHHQRSEFLKYMNMNKASAYKKKKMKRTHSGQPLDTSAVSGEMDVDDGELNRSTGIEFNPPLPREPPPPPPPEMIPSPPKPKKDDLEEGEISDDDTQSLGDLEERRRSILNELDDPKKISKDSGDTDKNTNKNTETLEDSNNSSDTNKEPSKTDDETQSSNPETSNSETSDSKERKHHRSHSKGFQLGAVIPESCTPYEKLPDADLWKVDITDHINFENLPDALGTWDRMKGLMSHVRKRVTELNADEDE